MNGIFIQPRALSGEWNVIGGPDNGERVLMNGYQVYPGPGRVNYTPEEWEREVNAAAGYARNTTRLISKATYRAFVEHLRDNHEQQQARLRKQIERYQEKGDTIGVEICSEYIADFTLPKGACTWNDGWQCISHAEMMGNDLTTEEVHNV